MKYKNSTVMKMINKRGLHWLICDKLMIFFIILTGIPAMAQSVFNRGIVAESIHFSGIFLENKAVSIGKDADKETNYKIVVAPSKVEDCPNKEKLVGLCSSIFQRREDDDPDSPYVYEYERKIIEASCADMKKDSEVEISRKVNIMWNKYENDLLVCTDGNFDVTKGSILKLAVSRRLVSVLEDAAQVWRVNLNRVDPSDQMTVLDYVRKEMKIYENTENERSLKEYYDLLRRAGAKHASELKK